MNIAVRVGDTTVETHGGRSLLDVCHEHDLPVEFSCRGGACGTCLVRVLDGADNLSPHTPNEEVLLPELAARGGPHRLACQAIVLGPVHLLWLPDTHPDRQF